MHVTEIHRSLKAQRSGPAGTLHLLASTYQCHFENDCIIAAEFYLPNFWNAWNAVFCQIGTTGYVHPQTASQLEYMRQTCHY